MIIEQHPELHSLSLEDKLKLSEELWLDAHPPKRRMKEIIWTVGVGRDLQEVYEQVEDARNESGNFPSASGWLHNSLSERKIVP